MSLLKIIKYGHPILREKALEIKSLGSREQDLIDSMIETMYANHGLGLAANQVGVLQRIFVLDVDQDREAEDEVATRAPRVFINPEITWESAEDEPFKEGCLSIPGVENEVFRPSQVKVSARDENFEPFEVEADELLARVIQHELDHLNGVLYVDRLSLLKRKLLGGKLNKIKSATMEELPSLPDSYPILIG
ncbi:MAG: peptide deformylase [Candidatus Sumerlaeaceae bacterium]|nr:peptide deformylase [Candidatus Sumerlaeaceae bacterium]